MSIRLKALLLAGPVTVLALLMLAVLVGIGAMLWIRGGSLPDSAAETSLEWIYRMAMRPLVVLATIVLLIGIGRIMHALLARNPAQPAIDLPRGDAPALWAELDRLRWVVGAPPIHRVVLTHGCNAGIRSDRRWLVGPRRNTMELGHFLLRLLDRQEATSVLLHELAHLRDEHGRLRGVVAYTGGMLMATALLLRDDEPESPGALRRAADEFLLQAMRTNRECEFDADAVAVAHLGAEVTARALLRIALAHRRALQRWRDDIDECLAGFRMRTDAPPLESFECVARPDPRDLGWLQAEVARPTRPDIGHPSLGARLNAMGASVRIEEVPAPVVESASAAFAWLGHDMRAIQTRLERFAAPCASAQHPAIVPASDELREALRELHTRIAELDAEALRALWTMARRVGETEIARVGLRELLARDIRDPHVLQWLLRVLLRSEDPAHRAAADATAARLAELGAVEAAEAIDAWADACAMHGATAKAHAAWRMLDWARLGRQHPGFGRAAWIEPSDIGPHGLAGGRCAAVQSGTLSQPWIDEAWLVRLHAGADLGPAALALVIRRRRGRWWSGAGSAWERDRNRLAKAVGGGVEILDYQALPRPTRERLRATPGARLV